MGGWVASGGGLLLDYWVGSPERRGSDAGLVAIVG
jgi:hypothetical protein